MHLLLRTPSSVTIITSMMSRHCTCGLLASLISSLVLLYADFFPQFSIPASPTKVFARSIQPNPSFWTISIMQRLGSSITTTTTTHLLLPRPPLPPNPQVLTVHLRSSTSRPSMMTVLNLQKMNSPTTSNCAVKVSKPVIPWLGGMEGRLNFQIYTV